MLMIINFYVVYSGATRKLNFFPLMVRFNIVSTKGMKVFCFGRKKAMISAWGKEKNDGLRSG